MEDLYKPHVGAICFDKTEPLNESKHANWFAVESIDGNNRVLGSDEKLHDIGNCVTCHLLFKKAKLLALTAEYEEVLLARTLLESYAYYIGKQDSVNADDAGGIAFAFDKETLAASWKMCSVPVKKRITEYRKATATAK